MTEHVYEGLFILDSTKYNQNPEEVSGQITKAIESFGGVVRVSRMWEERRLAYPIKGHKHGIYWLTYFRLDTQMVKDLNRQFQLTAPILRFLLVKIDERLEDALVQHALEEPKAPEEAPAEEEAAEDDVFDDDSAEAAE